MAHTPKNQVMEVVKCKAEKQNERYEGYRIALIKTMFEIMYLESAPPYNIMQQVSKKYSALAENLVKENGNTE